ncbi:hypothetical protein FQZ97_922920 [compost metagenome]
MGLFMVILIPRILGSSAALATALLKSFSPMLEMPLPNISEKGSSGIANSVNWLSKFNFSTDFSLTLVAESPRDSIEPIPTIKKKDKIMNRNKPTRVASTYLRN